MRILYMNQGGGGNWGALQYAVYDLLLIAESSTDKYGFTKVTESSTLPKMEIFQRDSPPGSPNYRLCTYITDLDIMYASCRPILAFNLRHRYSIWVVFMHLKSASQRLADESLQAAVTTLYSNYPIRGSTVIWIGDFNRASIDLPDTWRQYRGGGQSHWYLDRAVFTGVWIPITPSIAATSGDNAHIAISLDIPD